MPKFVIIAWGNLSPQYGELAFFISTIQLQSGRFRACYVNRSHFLGMGWDDAKHSKNHNNCSRNCVFQYCEVDAFGVFSYSFFHLLTSSTCAQPERVDQRRGLMQDCMLFVGQIDNKFYCRITSLTKIPYFWAVIEVSSLNILPCIPSSNQRTAVHNSANFSRCIWFKISTSFKAQSLQRLCWALWNTAGQEVHAQTGKY